MEFIDVREYLPGDDVRSIDWKVTARMDKPFVKKFVEERELTVILCVDASGSGYFGTRSQFKLEQAAQVAATIAFSAVTNNDKVGLLFFTDDVERFIPPRKGKQHVMRLIRDILLFQPAGAARTHRGAGVRDAPLEAEGDRVPDQRLPRARLRPERVRIPLGIAARRHDVVAVPITDPAERELPRVGSWTWRTWRPASASPWTRRARAAQALRGPHARHGDAPRPAVHAARDRLHRAPDRRGLHAQAAQVLPAPRPAVPLMLRRHCR
jgi:uncharacterized protein (DUF58 family)